MGLVHNRTGEGDDWRMIARPDHLHRSTLSAGDAGKEYTVAPNLVRTALIAVFGK
jgi:hypothetical protein